MFNPFILSLLILSVLPYLCSNAVTTRRDKSILYSRSLITILVCCYVISYSNIYLNFTDKGIGLFHGLFHTTAVNHTFHLFIFFISAVILQLNSFYPRKMWTEDLSSIYKLIFCKLVYFNSFILNKMAEQFRILEYPLIIVFIIIGGIFLVACSDLISVFLAIELQSYGLYILCSIYRNSEKATSAGLTYFLLGGLSSCFILLGSALLYVDSGDTSFDGIYIINNISNATINLSETNNNNLFVSWYKPYYINFSLVFMSIGFLFKVTAAPFHFWSPDVYDAIPTIVTTFVAIFAKISIFILLLELVYYTSNFFTFPTEIKQVSLLFNYSWTFTLLLSSLLSFIIGSVLGLTQFRVKRLYAYSTISHVGFILLALTINSVESVQSFIFYLMQYSLSNLNAFILLIAIGYSLYLYVEKDAIEKKTSFLNDLTPAISNKKDSPLQFIFQIKGYFNINPTLAISLAITIFSFVGIPPLIGFFAKQMVLSAALDSGYVFITFVAIVTSVISAYYYLALIKQIFFYESEYIINPQIEDISIKGTIVNSINNNNLKFLNISYKNIVLSSSLAVTISVLTLTILLFILNPEEWSNLANILALILFSF